MRNENLEVEDFEAGIELVDMKEVKTTDKKKLNMELIKAVVSFILDIVCVYILVGILNIRSNMAVVAIVGVSVILIVSVVTGIKKAVKIERRYSVKLDQTVDFKEFNSKYKIINQDGDIYTVVPTDRTAE